ncbi:MAG: hypothetical protein HUU16_14230, partial [Candidatus Omnitrophica bacterium]|nr:hypothetical protein [Candidatus Omnitrophota bacterium]
GDWKLLYNIDAPRQLFNLRDDPDELDNRADKRTDKVAELEAGLRAICDPERENRRADDYILRQLAEIKVEGGRSRAGDG